MSNKSSVSNSEATERSAEKSPPIMKKVAFASFVGTAIEYYDFFVYGTAAALVFPTVFFPEMTPALAATASFATFAVAFLSRPLGAAIFGHFGDRLGRKKTLVATLLIMGLSTVAVGILPGSAVIGVAAPIILLALRLLQGVAVGGEWAGSALLSAEYAPANKRGLYGMFTQLGVGAGLVLTNLVFLVVNFTMGEKSEAFLAWGWRVPFLFSAVLVIVALYVRLTIEETPVFRAEKAKSGATKAPIVELFRHQGGRVVLAGGCILGAYIYSFMGGTFLLGYASTSVHHPRTLILVGGVLGGLALMAVTALSAILCDKYGRRAMMILGFGLALPWSFAVIPLLDTGSAALFILGVMGTSAIMGVFYGPLASFIPELFATRYRYTGASLAFHVSGIIGGAIPPLIIGGLLVAYGSWAVGAMMATLVLLSLLSTIALKETRNEALDAVH
ncbi:MFS transporter [Arthrobacter sp. SLBN-112]|uniref:MFS transporter n=1 Tax=Arthrobacter sp. SLBN-112 TaxID=2768452 RepID=UPI0027B70E64|nr:MFS transporter [Arthrobacter sp. SLBN-112]MDQ0799503.1 MFS family permease [Arthrobacter sp. SLBN-112]